MVNERTLRTHMHAIRALLSATQERFDTLLSDMRSGRADSYGTEEELRRLCAKLDDLTAQCAKMEAYLAQRENSD